MSWAQTTQTTGFKATGGRRAFNAKRQRLAIARRQQIARWLAMKPGLSGAAIARRLGVHRSQICRDLAKLKAWLTRFRLGGVADMGDWWAMYAEGRAVGNVFTDLFGRLRVRVKRG